MGFRPDLRFHLLGNCWIRSHCGHPTEHDAVGCYEAAAFSRAWRGPPVYKVAWAGDRGRAALVAGVAPAQVARHFGLSLAAVRRVLEETA